MGDRCAVLIWFLFLCNCYLHHARTLVPAYQLLLSCEISPLNKEKYSVSFTPVKTSVMITSINKRMLALEKQVSGKTGLTSPEVPGFGDFKGLTGYAQSLFFSYSIDQEEDINYGCSSRTVSRRNFLSTHSAGNTGASSASSSSSTNSMSINSFLMTTCSLKGHVCLTSPVSRSTRVLGRLLVMIPLTGRLKGSLVL